MAVFRVEKNRGYTVMSNFHLKDTSLTLKAKGLLSMMLSLPDEWNYTTRGLAAICKEGVDSIGSTLRELEKQGYIIRNQLRDSKGRISDTEYIIYEHPQHNPDTDIPHTEKPYLDNPDMDKPYLENPAQLITNRLTTNQEKKDLLITEVSNPNRSYLASGTNTTAQIGLDWMGCDNITELRELVLDNLEYEFIKKSHDREQLDEIVDIIVETLCSTKPTINISGEEYPARLVKEKLLRLDSSHIDYVFECLQKTTTYVRNIKRYLLATLFNAPSTIGNYYSALVNHDLYGGR
ncbi:DUF6017 domain-containing protein [Clostridium minihomine]|uniref:DUF6017 domain-containing protein n=1 Tax=Clostridium minihomine TaxID=2045012 RepID=UPI000C766B95|nr:DUF6017 domain-containing protein [Clostridium minihomine]